MEKHAAIFLFACLGLSGCFWENPEELERLTKEDPAFKQMIVARDQAHAEERSIRADLVAQKNRLDGQIDKLRAEYDAYAKAQNKKIERTLAAIEANRVLLERQIETASASLETKQKELEEYEKTLADVKKVPRESKGINLSDREKQKWEERALLLSERIRPLADEIQDLKLQIRLKKQKIHFLK